MAMTGAERARRFREMHPDKKAADNKAYREAHADYFRQKAKERRENEPEKTREYQREYKRKVRAAAKGKVNDADELEKGGL